MVNYLKITANVMTSLSPKYEYNCTSNNAMDYANEATKYSIQKLILMLQLVSVRIEHNYLRSTALLFWETS